MFHDQQIFLFQLAFGPRNGAFWQGKWTCRLLFFSGECARMAVGISRNAGRFSACPAREKNTMNGSVSKLYDIDSIAIPAELLALCVGDEFSALLCGRNAVLTVEGITRRTPTRCWS